MKNLKTRATAWLAGRRMGSTDNLLSYKAESTILPYRPDSKTQFELTSLKIKQLLEKKKYPKVVELLREYPHDFILKCLESFPFKALNKAVPDTFPIWETLLTKLHNSEDGYIPQFPYAACDELVLQIARLMEMCEDNRHEDSQELMQSCRRVLKKVYMQYNEVLEQLYKEYDKVEHALYTLSLHLPLGIDHTAVSLQQAIMEEVQACLVDYNDAIERLEEMTQNEVLSLNEALMERQTNGSENDFPTTDFPLAPNPNQVQLQERLYFNQCMLTTLQPSRRRGNLAELLEILSERIKGDKEVLAIFGNIRQNNESISDSEPVEPWLRRHQRAVEGVIAALKEIEKELEITLPKTDSETNLEEIHLRIDEGPQIVPLNRHKSLDEERPLLEVRRVSGTVVVGEYLWEDEEGEAERELSPPTERRPRSTSPHKILRTGGPVTGSMRSCHSTHSSDGSSTNLISGASVSVHDLHTTRETQPMLAFTRVQSLKTPPSRSVVAGKKKSGGIFPSSFTNLSRSSGNVSSKSKPKKLFRSGSGGHLPSWDRQVSNHYCKLRLQSILS